MFEKVLTTLLTTQYQMVTRGVRDVCQFLPSLWGGEVCEALLAHAVCPLALSSDPMPWTSHRAAQPEGQL